MVTVYKVVKDYTNGGNSSRYYDDYHAALEDFNRGDAYLSNSYLVKISAESLAAFMNGDNHHQTLQTRQERDGY